METISLHNIIPQVFCNREDLLSDVWNKELIFEKKRLYLIQADSGQGKSTLCSYLMGYRNDYTGKLLFDNRDASSLKVNDWVSIRKFHISNLFQELRLFPELTAMENVEIKNKLTNLKSHNEIVALFNRLGIEDKMNAKIGQMSFGQQQRVAMIRALVQPFDFIIADEPISHLDDANSKIMGQIMMEEAERQGAGVIVTSIGKHMDLNYERVLNL